MNRIRRWRAAYRSITESFMWKLLGRQRRWIYALLAASVLNFLVIIGLLDTLRRAFDDALIDQITQLDPLVSRLVGLAFLGLITGIAQRQIVARIGFHLEYELRLQIYRRLQTLDPKLLDNLPTGQLITRAMTDLTLVELLVQLIPTLGIALTLLGALAVLLIALHPVMGTVALLGIPVNLYLISRIRKPLLGFSWLALNRRAQVTTAIDEPVRGIRVVKSFGREDEERVRVRDAAKRAFAVSLNRVRMVAKYHLILQAIPLLLNTVILFLAGRAVSGGDFSVGKLLIFLIFTNVFTGFAQSFDAIASAYMFAKSGALRIFELLNWGGDEAVGQFSDHLVGSRGPQRARHGFVARLLAVDAGADLEVVANGSGEQERVLGDDPHRVSQLVGVKLHHVGAVEQRAPARRRDAAAGQRGHERLARAGPAHQQHHVARTDREVHLRHAHPRAEAHLGPLQLQALLGRRQ
jgi:ABC-type multidrug transport system fused ATPase/permease subunit